MTQAYSSDLRERVIDAIGGGLSRHKAATRFGIGVATAVRWHRTWREHGEREARKWLEKERNIKSSLPVVDIRWGDDEGLVSRLFGRVLGNWLPPQSLGLDGLVAIWHPSLGPAGRGAAAAAGRD